MSQPSRIDSLAKVSMSRALASITFAVSLLFTSWWVVAQTPPLDRGRTIERMSMSEMLAAGEEHLQGMRQALSDSFTLLEESIATGDVACTTARNESITAMKGLVKLSEENYVSLQQKAAEGDAERVEREYVKISIAAAKVGELFAQVRSACGVQRDLELTDVELSLSMEMQLPTSERVSLTFVTQDPVIIPEPPIHASPFF